MHTNAMHSRLRTLVAALAFVSPSLALAQAGANCPGLPADAGLRWEQMDGPGFLFCRALRGDGSEAFAVTLSGNSPFEPKRGKRAEALSVDGHDAHWYRSEIASDPDAIARETLLDIDGGNVAHISLRAASEAQKTEAMQQVESLEFGAARISSN